MSNQAIVDDGEISQSLIWRGWLLWAALFMLIPWALLARADGQQQGISVPHSVWVGNDFHEANDSTRAIYIAGLVDGFLGSPMFGGDSGLADAFHQCLLPMKIPQVAAIISKYVADHPEIWHQDMHALALQALGPICPAYDAANKAFWTRKAPSAKQKP